MDIAFEVTLKGRQLLENILNNHSLEELNKVPDGFKNNIIWNIAHVIVTQQLLVYKLSGLPMMVSDGMVNAYRKGTKTEGDVSREEVNVIRGLLFSTIEKTKEDYANKKFKDYSVYTTSTNSTLSSVEEATQFNIFHEGTHLGYILALRKSL
ncbi:MAG: hypothetical protein CMC76_02145 [Flavobacteriaceae bacterium]|uniref:DinB family protein n=1 Tax=Winogradskyella sp. SYSU M77433 TaxID=3042722 RepID=UPI000C651782|nr:DinB family protein [Winogradskyella sp. SYSU M77433]MAX69890.1 hypothetical protein [Flavobacteriaceae bacterium]MDH7912277.1 DinB family protein [Winogradskyella sp. SYSU M77433]|tara:strand:+ start:551 stop:1006 length:456 start_codon:yes stop_codon:yes gene_type:complete